MEEYTLNSNERLSIVALLKMRKEILESARKSVMDLDGSLDYQISIIANAHGIPVVGGKLSLEQEDESPDVMVLRFTPEEKAEQHE